MTAHDLETPRRFGFILFLSIVAGVLPLLGMLETIYVVRHTYVPTGSALELVTICWYGLLAVLFTFLVGAAFVALYIRRYGRFPALFRTRAFLVALFVPVALAFASIYLGAFISAGDATFGSNGIAFPTRYLGLPSLVSRFRTLSHTLWFL